MKHKKHNPWSAHDWRCAQDMLAEGASYQAIADRLGISLSRVQMKFSNEASRERLRERSAKPAPDRSVTAEQEIERDRRREAAQHRTLSQQICGDPAPGFSALDRKRGATP